MLLLLTVGLLIGSVLVLVLKRNQMALLLADMCLSLTLFFLGLMIFIAKKGGYTSEVMSFLYFSSDIRSWVQYLSVPLNRLGYLIALGRYLFPLFLLKMALQYSMIPVVRRHERFFGRLTCILPLLSLVVYWPPVYLWIVHLGLSFRDALVFLSYIWVVGYVALALLLMVVELCSITMPFCRRQFCQIFVCIVALSLLYLLYCGQDPGQVYRFYSYDYILIKGVGYLQYDLSVAGFWVLVVGNVICGILGLGNLLRYTRDSFTSDRDEVVLERKFDVARTGVSVFVHSIKNQLLANRVLHKRIRAELEKEVPDVERLRAYNAALSDNNEQLLRRSEELYHTVKAKSVRLVPTELGSLAELASARFLRKYPDGKLEVMVDGKVQVLADENYLSEALYNLMTNAWESNLLAEHSDSPISLISHQERLYTVLEVCDHGTGITSSALKHIYEPFYSNKNTNSNWGMGLYLVRTILRSHLGSIRVENHADGGASFFAMLPRYDHRSVRRREKL